MNHKLKAQNSMTTIASPISLHCPIVAAFYIPMLFGHSLQQFHLKTQFEKVKDHHPPAQMLNQAKTCTFGVQLDYLSAINAQYFLMICDDLYHITATSSSKFLLKSINCKDRTLLSPCEFFACTLAPASISINVISVKLNIAACRTSNEGIVLLLQQENNDHQSRTTYS